MSYSVPPEVARKIVRLLNDRRMLAVLARTTRTFQAIAERYLYNDINILPHPDKIPLLEALAQVPRVAQLVRYFKFSVLPPRNQTNALYPIMRNMIERPEFWLLLRDAIHNLGFLEYFEIDDEPYMPDEDRLVHSAVLSPPPPLLRAGEIRLSFPLNDHVCAFLATQTTLRKLHMPEFPPSDNEDLLFANLPNNAVPKLTLFEGPIFTVNQLLDCPITRLKVTLDSSEAIDALPNALRDLYRLKDLYSLSIVNWPMENVLSLIEVVSHACPGLHYLSVVPYPMHHDDKLEMFRSLMRLKKLRVLQLDLTEWRPLPLGPIQRTFAAELRTYIPTLLVVTFWTNRERTHWCFNQDNVEPTLAIRPRRSVDAETVDAASSGSGSGRSKAAEPHAEAGADTVPGRRRSGGTHQTQTSRNELEEAKIEGRLTRYIGVDGWAARVQCYPNVHWSEVASKDDLWGSSNLPTFGNGVDSL